MHLVKKCPSCSRKLRFPIDRGKIRVSCSCGANFVADPDDTSLYDGATFDLGTGAAPSGARAGASLEDLKKRGDAFLDGAIRASYTLRYRLQNFRILPAAEQKKILIALLLIMAVLLIAGYLICAPGPVPPGDGVI